MAAKTSTPEERKAGDQDPDQDTKEEEESTGGEATEEEGVEGTGALTRGLVEGISEDGEMTGEILRLIQPESDGGTKATTETCRGLNRCELDLLGLSGSEEGSQDGPELEVTLRSTVARRKALMVLRTWGEAGTVEAGGGHLEEAAHPEEQVRRVLPLLF